MHKSIYLAVLARCFDDSMHIESMNRLSEFNCYWKCLFTFMEVYVAFSGASEFSADIFSPSTRANRIT